MLKNVFARSRTRVYCLEGNYPNRWTTNALMAICRVKSVTNNDEQTHDPFPNRVICFFLFNRVICFVNEGCA